MISIILVPKRATKDKILFYDKIKVNNETSYFIDLEGWYSSFIDFHRRRPKVQDLLGVLDHRCEPFWGKKWESKGIDYVNRNILPKLLTWPKDGIIGLL